MHPTSPLALALVLLLSLAVGCTAPAGDDSISTDTPPTGAASSEYPNDVSPNDGIAACPEASSDDAQPCASGLHMRRVTDAPGVVDWLGFAHGTYDGTAVEYDLALDAEEFEFSRWTLAVASSTLSDPHVFLHWVDSSGTSTPVGGSVMEAQQSPGGQNTAEETKDASWQNVRDENGRLVRTLQMLISFTQGTTLRILVQDQAGGSGDFDFSLTIYTNRMPEADVRIIGPSKLTSDSTLRLDGCSTRDPDFLDRQNDDPFGKLTWMLDDTNESNASARIGGWWGNAPCEVSIDLSDRSLSLGVHRIHLLVRDPGTSTSEQPDDIGTVEFEIVDEADVTNPARSGVASLDVGLNEVETIEALSPMYLIDLPFTRRDISIAAGVRFELDITRTGSASLDYSVDYENGSFSLTNATADTDSSATFRPWLLVKYSIWSSEDRRWHPDELAIPMLSCLSVYDGMPRVPLAALVDTNNCDLHYWDRALPLDSIGDTAAGGFDLDEDMAMTAIDLIFILEGLSELHPPTNKLLDLLNLVGDVSVPLTFGVDVDASGILSMHATMRATGVTIDGGSGTSTTLLGYPSITTSNHQLAGDSGTVDLVMTPHTSIDVELSQTVGIGIGFTIFNVEVLSWDYQWNGDGANSLSQEFDHYDPTSSEHLAWTI